MTWDAHEESIDISSAEQRDQPLAAGTTLTRTDETRLSKFPLRLPNWQRITIYIVGMVVAVSGLLWLSITQLRDPDDIFSVWLSVERTVRTVHGSIALAMLAIIGSVLPVHVRLGWRGKLNRISGTSLLATLALLALTGGALYYMADDTWRFVTIWMHQIVGVLSIAICIIHRHGRLRGRERASLHPPLA
jgi:hypothetical protein